MVPGEVSYDNRQGISTAFYQMKTLLYRSKHLRILITLLALISRELSNCMAQIHAMGFVYGGVII